MNEIARNTHTGFSAVASMSTREIAEVCDKQHRNVMRDAEVMFKALGMDPEGYAQIWTHPQNGQTYREFILPKDLTLTLVAGYNIPLRHKIVKRLEEVEASLRPAQLVIPQSLPDALRLAADNAERADRAEAALEAAIPKVEALDRLEASEGSVGPRLAAKMLNVPERKFTAWLQANHWAFRTNGTGPLQAYIEKRNRGYLDHRPHTFRDQVTGEDRTIAQMVITPKGLKRLAEIVPGAGA